MKVAVLGASGIIGQHMRLSVPEGVEPLWVRKRRDPYHHGVDLTDLAQLDAFLDTNRPDVIVNLAGESNVDFVEREQGKCAQLNVRLPMELARWCDANAAHLIQVSSQAVFAGSRPPYDERCVTFPVNVYGLQKAAAETHVQARKNWSIARPTFVLGVRPFPFVGRENPVEQMLTHKVQRQVGDRWFSVSFARDVAADLWALAQRREKGLLRHIGIPFRVNRWELANHLAAGVERVAHADFPGLAQRPEDTTYAGAGSWAQVAAGLFECQQDYTSRAACGLRARAREIALFLNLDERFCLEKLGRGFGDLHNAVTRDFNSTTAGSSDGELLEWYRNTRAYIWELSAYHCEPGFNYSGMCKGIADRLADVGTKRVLCLGDGIGDLTLGMIRHGLDAVYHDLAGSQTANFAQFRAWMYLGKYMPVALTNGWTPRFEPQSFDAVVSLDYLEHVPNVEQWVAAIHSCLKPGGLFFAQNAFACGSGPQGAMPMHLAVNDRWEKEWDPHLAGAGFTQESSNWYRKTAAPMNGVHMVTA